MTIAQFAGKKSTTSPGRSAVKTSSIHGSLLQERDVLNVQDAERLTNEKIPNINEKQEGTQHPLS
jgi:hypothetical protein